MELQDLRGYAEDSLAELITYNITKYVEISDATSTLEDLEEDFDGDSYCPYCSQQGEVIARYESDFGREAEDICDYGATYKASEFEQARAAYAYAIADCGFESYFGAAKSDLIEALEEFENDAHIELTLSEDILADGIKVQLTTRCPHGWAPHDRELEDGTMVWESGQLDGCNGMSREVSGVWISCCISPAKKAEETC